MKKIIKNYGSYEEFEESIKNYDLEKLFKIQGISQKVALDIVRKIHGQDNSNFLKTEQSVKIYEDIITRIIEFTNTDYARTRILLLNPTTDYNTIFKTQELITDTLEQTSDLDYAYIRELYKKIEPLNDNIRPKFNDEYAIVCEDYEDYLTLIKKGFDRYCNILQ